MGVGPGLKLGHHDGAAALLIDGKTVAAAEEERFLREKHARGSLPLNALKYCLREAGLFIKDVDILASPLATYRHFDQRLADYVQFQFGYSPPIKLVDHHLCHAASAYFGSGYETALCISLDFSGDSSAGLICVGDRTAIRPLARIPRERSLGAFYGMLTQYLGFQMTEDEYKVMGLASGGLPNEQHLAVFARMIASDALGGIHVDSTFDQRGARSQIYTTDVSTRQERIYSDRWVAELGPPRHLDEPIKERHRDIAASGQKHFEHVVSELVGYWQRRTGLRQLCLAGGCFLNVKLNSTLAEMPGVDSVFVHPASSDAGVPLGAAMLASLDRGFTPAPLDDVFLGPSYGSNEIVERLRALKVDGLARQVNDVREVAHELADGKIIGWFQGRMEFGPRALGNRSILADPRPAEMQDRVNKAIKFRETFRPFAPSATVEGANQLFEKIHDGRFMTFLTTPKAGLDNKVTPSVIHVDGTSRLQIVTRESNARFWELLTAFGNITGVPALLNTSLNVRGEPICCSPDDAIKTFFGSGMDHLVLDNWMLSKR